MEAFDRAAIISGKKRLSCRHSDAAASGKGRLSMRISLCVGEYSATPFYITGLDMPICCMEELCYCLKENAFLLDTSLLEDGLADWIGNCCGLQELARELYPLIHKQGSLSALVTLILEYVGFYSAETIRDVEQVIKQGAGLSSIEKRKKQIDYMVSKKKYLAAIKGYDTLLSTWREGDGKTQEVPAAGIRASILHNKGVALAGMMLYDQAAEIFHAAYETEPNEASFQAYLAAKRMELEEGEYISFVAELTEHYDETLKLEKQIEQIALDWQEHVDYKRLEQRLEWRAGNEKQKYYDENERLILALKNSYRSSVSE